MSPRDAVLLAVLLVNLSLGAVVVARDPRRQENRWYGLFCMAVVFWAQVEFLGHQLQAGLSEQRMFAALATPGWAFLVPAFLYFARAHAGAFGLMRSERVPMLFLASALALSAVSWVPGALYAEVGVELADGGRLLPGPLQAILAVPHVLLGTAIGVIHLALHVVRSRDPDMREQALFFAGSFLLTLFGGFAIQHVAPLVGHGDLSHLALPLVGFNAALIGLGILRFRLFQVTPEALAETIVENMGEGLLLANRSGVVVHANPAAAELIGTPEIGLAGRELSQLIHPADAVESAIRKVRHGERVTGDGVVRGVAWDRRVPVEFSIGSAESGEGRGARALVCVIRDVGPLKALVRQLEEASRQLAHQATTDALTGVHNRRYLDTRLAEQFAASVRHGIPLSLVVIDLDHFGAINKTRGHEWGDRALCAVADALQREVRGSDVVTRYGGDEFVVLLPYTEADVARVVAERLRGAVEEALARWRGGGSASLGVVTFSGEECLQDAADLLQLGDRAMRESKACGRNQVIERSPHDWLS